MGQTEDRNFSRVIKKQTFKIASCNDYASDGLWVTLTSVNLSQGGILFDSPEEYIVGDEYIIRFTGTDNKLHDERIKIIRTKEILTKTHYNIAAVFVDSDSEKISSLIQ